VIKTISLILSITAATLLFPVTSLADTPPMTDGVIKKIKMESGKVTIKHGEIANLEMPPMSMVFNVKDPASLENLKKGDKIKFVAVDEDGKLWATEIEADSSE